MLSHTWEFEFDCLSTHPEVYTNLHREKKRIVTFIFFRKTANKGKFLLKLAETFKTFIGFCVVKKWQHNVFS